MPSKKDKKKGVETGKNKRRVIKYATLKMLFPSLPAAKRKQIAGYSKSSDTSKIEQSTQYKAIISPENQREALQSTPGYMMVDLVNKLRQVMENDLPDDIEIKAGDIIRAVKEQKEILGYKAPEELEVTQRGLFLHLAGHSTEELQAAYNQITQGKAA